MAKSKIIMNDWHWFDAEDVKNKAEEIVEYYLDQLRNINTTVKIDIYYITITAKKFALNDCMNTIDALRQRFNDDPIVKKEYKQYWQKIYDYIYNDGKID